MIVLDRLPSTNKRRLNHIKYSNCEKGNSVDSSHGIGSPAPASGELDAPEPFVWLSCWLRITESDDLPG